MNVYVPSQIAPLVLPWNPSHLLWIYHLFSYGIQRPAKILFGFLPIFPISLMILSVASTFQHLSSVLCPLEIDLMGMSAILWVEVCWCINGRYMIWCKPLGISYSGICKSWILPLILMCEWCLCLEERIQGSKLNWILVHFDDVVGPWVMARRRM